VYGTVLFTINSPGYRVATHRHKMFVVVPARRGGCMGVWKL